MSNAATKKLLAHQWPGNVRELQNVLKRLVVVGDQIEDIFDSPASTRNGDSIKDFARKYGGIIEQFGLDNPDFDWEGFSLKKVSKEAQRMAERIVISHVLEQTGWNRSRSQKILQISYKTLLYKIEELNLTPPEI